MRHIILITTVQNMKVPDIIMAEDFFPHRITFDKKVDLQPCLQLCMYYFVIETFLHIPTTKYVLTYSKNYHPFYFTKHYYPHPNCQTLFSFLRFPLIRRVFMALLLFMSCCHQIYSWKLG